MNSRSSVAFLTTPLESPIVRQPFEKSVVTSDSYEFAVRSSRQTDRLDLECPCCSSGCSGGGGLPSSRPILLSFLANFLPNKSNWNRAPGGNGRPKVAPFHECSRDPRPSELPRKSPTLATASPYFTDPKFLTCSASGPLAARTMNYIVASQTLKR